MHHIVVAAAALNQTPLSWESNARNILGAIAEAKRSKAAVLCLPELCITGYGCEDSFHSPGVLARALQSLKAIAPATRGLIVNVGLPIECNGAVYNASALLVDGKIVALVPKRHLAGDGIHYEPRWFKAWPSGVASSLDIDGVAVPVGDLFFEVNGITIGFEICEEAWVSNRPGIELTSHGVDLILNPSASHFAFGKRDIRRRFVLEGSRAFGSAYVYANLLGCEAGRIIYDGDTMIAADGAIVAQGPRFSFKDFVVTAATVDLDITRLTRFRRASFQPRFDDCGRRIEVKGVRLPRASYIKAPPLPEWESALELKHEEFCRAVSLGLFDYLRKSKSHGFVVSLSGGVDSSAASCLVVLMMRLAIREIGLRAFKSKLSYIEEISSLSEKEIVPHFLACVYQGSENSSRVTREAARAVAQDIGSAFFDLDISGIVKQYERIVGEALGEKIAWDTHDLPKQNIQARVRSPSVWLIANLRRSLLLSTSNRSEAAVGYTTMDGDSSGGLSPLGGIDKAYLRTWLVWLEMSGPEGLWKFPSLRLVNAQQPTAELRPLVKGQTDEGDLMPYVVLDRIERLAIRDKMMPSEVLISLEREFAPRYAKKELRLWTIRFFRLWSMNQWKRERYAPSFHLDDENLDPKTWCRFPILSGGFEEELELLSRPKK